MCNSCWKTISHCSNTWKNIRAKRFKHFWTSNISTRHWWWKILKICGKQLQNQLFRTNSAIIYFSKTNKKKQSTKLDGECIQSNRAVRTFLTQNGYKHKDVGASESWLPTSGDFRPVYNEKRFYTIAESSTLDLFSTWRNHNQYLECFESVRGSETHFGRRATWCKHFHIFFSTASFITSFSHQQCHRTHHAYFSNCIESMDRIMLNCIINVSEVKIECRCSHCSSRIVAGNAHWTNYMRSIRISYLMKNSIQNAVCHSHSLYYTKQRRPMVQQLVSKLSE